MSVDAGPLPGRLAAWDFDEDRGATVRDRCGRGHHGTLTTPRQCIEVQLGNSSYNDRVNGDLDQIRFYGRRLSDSDVVEDMRR
ncbi:MAG: hypothetical protein JNK82_26575 [Myxococcaceae bacterium]|nr:hypothetical protein [Myxococcaceae bacterium]